MEKQISIITVNYNGFADTCELIDALPLQNPLLETIVVDNGSKCDEAALIKEKYPGVVAIRSEENLGFAGGNNIGIKAAKSKCLFFLNNDTLVKGTDDEKTSSILSLRDVLFSSESIGMVCPKICFSWGEQLIQFAGYTPLSKITLRNTTLGLGEKDSGQHDTPHPTPYAHGAAMMVKREVIDKVGYMPECYFLYYEELDWSMMIGRAGYEIVYSPAMTVFHKESQATGQNSPLKSYYMTRNRLMLVKRNSPSPHKYLSYAYLFLVVASRDIFKHLARGNFKHVNSILHGLRDFMKSKESKYTGN